MSKNIQLKTITCPNCGDKLKYEKEGETVICMSCESPIVIKGEENYLSENVKPSKIDEIKTSSTALAYIEQFLDEYDWESFVFDYDFSIEELDKLINALKITAADDHRTWVAAFVCLVVPFEKKIEYRKKALEYLIDEFKNKNLDAYGMYDAYKKIASAIVARFNSVKEQAIKIISYAEKYGAPADTISKCKQQLDELNIGEVQKTIFDKIEDIPEVINFNAEEQKKIVDELAKKGIDAEYYYSSAIADKNQGEYKSAIEKFVAIRGYKDSEKQIDDMENGFVFSDTMFIKDKYYYLAKNEETSKFNALEVENYIPSTKATIKNISKIIKLYANSVYYTTGKSLNIYDFVTNKDTVLCNENITDYKFDLYNQAIYLVNSDESGYTTKYSLSKLSLIDHSLTNCEKEISNIYGFIDEYCAFEKKQEEDGVLIKRVYIYNLMQDKLYCIGKGAVDIFGYIDNSVVFAKNNPDDYNKNLYIIKLEDAAQPVLLEANITGNCQVVNGKIYYYTLDNIDNKILISINADGTDRKELATYVDKILFVSGKWIYFKRIYRYNTALCKVRVDGSKVDVIATQIDEFIKIESGYLYYISDDRKMHTVRIDGTKNKILCSSVDQVLIVKENKIVFTALDRLIRSTTSLEGIVSKEYSKSIYAIDFNAQGRRKAVYNIEEASNNGDDVFFTKIEKIGDESEERAQRYLYKLNINDYSVDKITRLKAPNKAGCYVATCVYGSYDCPEVWTLRRYRDNTLGSTWYGRAFIKLYYAISPTLVKWFGKTKWFKKMWKGKLDRMVERLNKSGVDNTPYKDKEW